MSTVITIGGVTVTTPRPVTPKSLIAHVQRGIPTFVFEVRGGPLPTSTDPYLGKEVRVTINGVLRFVGDVIRRDLNPPGGSIGWIRTYSAFGLRNRGDKVPHTDGNNGSDASSYNMAADNQALDYLASRAGRTVGQILTDMLVEVDNATALDAHGIGAYTSLTPPTLPAATVADLAALTLIPPSPVRVGGEKLLNALDGFLSQWAPNHALNVEPDGTIRVRDTRTYSAHTFTINSDPILPTPLSRDLSEAFQRVVVRGQGIAEMFLFSLKWGTLDESPFAHDGLTVAAAKAAWTSANYFTPDAASEGTCTCPSTTSVTLDPTDNAQTWAANYWDQTSTGKHGWLALTYSIGTTITTICQRLVTANASLSAGGTSTFTLDRALPHLNFDNFVLRGMHAGPSAVWCEYALPSWAAAKLAKQSTYPFPFKFSGGAGETQISLPMGSVCWSSSGSPPYVENSVAITVDPAAGTVRFAFPTFLTCGSKTPTDVRALVPIYTGVNEAISPADVAGVPQYAGTSHTAEGLSDTLTVTVDAWRDPANLTAMQAYAADLLDSVKDAIIEGSVTYLGLYENALTPGLAVNVAGNGYTTGWEAAALPVVECQLTWGTAPGTPMNYITTMKCSNRRAHFSDVAFLHPDRTGVTFGFGDNSLGFADWMGGAGAAYSAAAAGIADTFGQAAATAGIMAANAAPMPDTGTAGPQWQGGIYNPAQPFGNILQGGDVARSIGGPADDPLKRHGDVAKSPFGPARPVKPAAHRPFKPLYLSNKEKEKQRMLEQVNRSAVAGEEIEEELGGGGT